MYVTLEDHIPLAVIMDNGEVLVLGFDENLTVGDGILEIEILLWLQDRAGF